jgi:hypothetical protein
MPITMDDAEKLKRLVVEPVVRELTEKIEGLRQQAADIHVLVETQVAQVRASMDRLEKMDEDTLARVRKLESFKLRLFGAASIIGGLAGILVRAGWDLATSLIHRL